MHGRMVVKLMNKDMLLWFVCKVSVRNGIQSSYNSVAKGFVDNNCDVNIYYPKTYNKNKRNTEEYYGNTKILDLSKLIMLI